MQLTMGKIDFMSLMEGKGVANRQTNPQEMLKKDIYNLVFVVLYCGNQLEWTYHSLVLTILINKTQLSSG